MLIIIGAVVLISWICVTYGAEAGAVAMLIAAGVFIVFAVCSGRKDTRAWANRRNYWAAGGPDRYRER